MVIFGKTIKAVGVVLFTAFNLLGIADFVADLLISFFMSNLSRTKSGKLRANVYVLLTSRPVDGNRYVDDFVTQFNLVPGRKIVRRSDALVIGEVYTIHEQLKVYLIRAIVEEI